MVYSGDVDGIVPVTGTRRWVASLDLPERKEWKPWVTPVDEQVRARGRSHCWCGDVVGWWVGG